MKRLVIALTAIAAFTGSALAADMAPRYAKAAPAPVAYAPSWTGCWIGAGGGYGMFNNDSYLIATATGIQTTTPTTQGGRGYLATVGVGCDYQFGGKFVVGAFADGDWTNIRGDHTGSTPGAIGLGAVGTSTMDWAWSVGGRVGYLITPSLLTYFTGGYTEAEFSGVTYRNIAGALVGTAIPSTRYQGWFLGAGDEYALGFLPGLFWKTEYRFADYGTKDVGVYTVATGLSNGSSERTHHYVHTIRSGLTYHFNWGGPVVAKY